MEYRRYEQTIVLRLDKGDEIMESLKSVAKRENIRLASISGIGGSDDITFGIFDDAKRDYNHFSLTSLHEITNLAGNLTIRNGEPFSHVHVTCAGKDGVMRGGHLLRCVISLTGEIFLHILDGDISRREVPELGIRVFNFDN